MFAISAHKHWSDEANSTIKKKKVEHLLSAHSPHLPLRPFAWPQLRMLIEQSRPRLWGGWREAPLLLFLYLTWRALSRCAETAGLSGEHNKLTESKMGTLVWPGTPNTGPWSVRRAGEMESQRPFVQKWLRLSGKAGQKVRVAKHHCAIERLWQDRAKNGERHEV